MTLYRTALAFLVSFAMTTATFADIVGERKYLFSELDELWNSTVGQAPPQAQWYLPLLDDSGDLRLTRPETEANVTARDSHDVTGVSVDGGRTSTHAFPVIAIPDATAPILYQRFAQLELYLNRYGSFSRQPGDTGSSLDTLRRRQISAATELYLTSLMLYFAESSLEGKCKRLVRLTDFQRTSLQNIVATDLEPLWKPIFHTYTTAKARLEADAARELVCAAKPVRNRATIREAVTNRVRERMLASVKKKTDDTLSLLNQAEVEFEALTQSVDVGIKSAEILELERLLSNVQSNLLLVKEDQLKSAATISTVQSIDLSQLDQPSDLAEYEQAKAQLNAMAGEISATLQILAQFPTASSNRDAAQALAVCAPLSGIYENLSVTDDTQRLTTSVTTLYDQCLKTTIEVVKPFLAPSVDKVWAAALSHHIRQLSDAFLASEN